jgi:hypothetical protein
MFQAHRTATNLQLCRQHFFKQSVYIKSKQMRKRIDTDDALSAQRGPICIAGLLKRESYRFGRTECVRYCAIFSTVRGQVPRAILKETASQDAKIIRKPTPLTEIQSIFSGSGAIVTT